MLIIGPDSKNDALLLKREKKMNVKKRTEISVSWNAQGDLDGGPHENLNFLEGYNLHHCGFLLITFWDWHLVSIASHGIYCVVY